MTELLRSELVDRVAVVFDLEFTAWEGSLERGWSDPDEEPEIIQIGAVIVRKYLDQWKLCEEFSRYVKPTRRPQLSQYIIDLTGITQEIIDRRADSFVTAILSFASFIPNGATLCCNGDDWSILQLNCELLGIDNPLQTNSCLNVRPYLARCLQVGESSGQLHSYRLMNSIAATTKTEPLHDALLDARSIAQTLIALGWNT